MSTELCFSYEYQGILILLLHDIFHFLSVRYFFDIKRRKFSHGYIWELRFKRLSWWLTFTVGIQVSFLLGNDSWYYEELILAENCCYYFNIHLFPSAIGNLYIKTKIFTFFFKGKDRCFEDIRCWCTSCACCSIWWPHELQPSGGHFSLSNNYSTSAHWICDDK